MAARHFVRGIEFGEGSAQIGEQEQRIVAEASVSTRRRGDLAAAGANGSLERVVVVGQHCSTHVAGGALCRWCILQALEQQFVVGLVEFGAAQVGVSGIEREASSAYTGLVAQRSHFESRVIRQSCEACFSRKEERLRACVFQE